jgi:type VI secretion system secreted protein Hcp
MVTSINRAHNAKGSLDFLRPNMPIPFYVKVHGSTQGDFHGESSNAQRTGWIDGVDFELQVTSPIDSATGQPTGKRQWSPVIFTKKWGAASPQFLQALVTDEVLDSVVFEFQSVHADGTEGTYYVVQLANASMAGDRQATASSPGETATNALERIELTFRKISVEDMDAGTTFTDDLEH